VDLQKTFYFISGGDCPVARTETGADGSSSVSERWILQERPHRAPDLIGGSGLRQNPPSARVGDGLTDHLLIDEAVHRQHEQWYAVGESTHRGRVPAVAHD
jgi:hypothetical protein